MTTVLYVTPGTFKATTQIPDGLGDEDVERALAAASGAVEGLCDRRFWLDPEDVTRTYTALSSRRMVVIDDLAVLTSVTSDGTAFTAFIKEPQNADVDGKPFTRLKVTRNSGSLLSCEEAGISVTGRFGWPEVPAQVEQFVSIVAGKLVKRSREAPFGIVGSGGLENMAMRLAREDPDTMLLISSLRRHHPVIA